MMNDGDRNSRMPASPMRGVRVVAIGASAGGTEALMSLVPALPANFPCVVVVQHLPAGFAEMFAARLGAKGRLAAFVAKGGEEVRDGTLYVAQSGRHLLVERRGGGLFLKLGCADKTSRHCPSADALFQSVAEQAGDEAMGVILSGMGTDGARGLLAMRKAGAYTIGQDEKTCVVYGMPREAYIQGAVTRQLPLSAIAGEMALRARIAR